MYLVEKVLSEGEGTGVVKFAEGEGTGVVKDLHFWSGILFTLTR